MKTIVTGILFVCISCFASGQERTISAFLSVQFNSTLYDYTRGNNPWGIGSGLQVFINNKTKFKPLIDFTADVYLANDKVLRANPDGSFPENDNSIGGLLNLFLGSSFYPQENFCFSLSGGPSFINGDTYVGIKPSFGFYLSPKKRWIGKISYINVFDREKMSKNDFGSVSISIALKLF